MNITNFTKLVQITFLAASIVASSPSSGAEKKEPIIWFIWDLEPEFVKSGPWKKTGYADKFLQYFIDNLPSYDHTIQEVNIPRWSRDALKPNRCAAHLWGGFFPGKLVYSKPYSFTPPHVAVFHKRHQKRIGPKDSVVSLKELLKQTDLTLMILRLNLDKGALQSRYPILFQYLAPYVGKSNLIELSGSSNVVNLKLLDRNRADYTLGYPTTITAQRRIKNLGDDYITYRLKEHNLYKTVHVACNNDRYGRDVINKINTLLTKETLMKFLSYHEEWNGGDAEFRRTTVDYFIRRKALGNVSE